MKEKTIKLNSLTTNSNKVKINILLIAILFFCFIDNLTNAFNLNNNENNNNNKIIFDKISNEKSLQNSNDSKNILGNPTTFTSFIEVDSKSISGTSPNPNQIQGKMEINGENYNAICDCNPVSPLESDNPINDQQSTGPKCDPSKLRIHEERKGQGATFDDIRNLIGNIEDLNYVVVPETSFRCLDGRNAKGVLGTPGGDAGEFILGLMVYEDLLGGGKKITQDNVDMYLTLYLKSMNQPKFYMCSDDAAVEHVQKELSIEGLNIQNPKGYLVKDLLNVLVKPENIGDLHLKMMMKYSQQFSIRKEIVEMFLRAFYKILWNKEEDLYKKLELDVLLGDHTESAFVEVRSEDACQKAQLSPLILTKNKKTSVFLNHLDAVSIRRAQLAKFFVDIVNRNQDDLSPLKMHNRLNHHGYIALEITGSYAAKGLPFYTINLA